MITDRALTPPRPAPGSLIGSRAWEAGDRRLGGVSGFCESVCIWQDRRAKRIDFSPLSLLWGATPLPSYNVFAFGDLYASAQIRKSRSERIIWDFCIPFLFVCLLNNFPSWVPLWPTTVSFCPLSSPTTRSLRTLSPPTINWDTGAPRRTKRRKWRGSNNRFRCDSPKGQADRCPGQAPLNTALQVPVEFLNALFAHCAHTVAYHILLIFVSPF